MDALKFALLDEVATDFHHRDGHEFKGYRGKAHGGITFTPSNYETKISHA